MKTAVIDKTLLADAVAELIETLHQKYAGITTKPVPHIEDEDFALEITVPQSLSIENVETESQKICIALEDKYNVYVLPLVVCKK
ncbi:MAG: hypothetical protein HZC49_09825 [Nitrospirae bacterium]|nr:hypothetical protein [Nitrospirota bacterium]